MTEVFEYRYTVVPAWFGWSYRIELAGSDPWTGWRLTEEAACRAVQRVIFAHRSQHGFPPYSVEP